MDISILGELEVDDGTTLIDVGGARERAIVETLALSAGEAVTVDTLIDSAWGDDPPPTAEKSLQSHISRIRRRLPSGLIETTDHGYRLDVRPEDVDAHRLVHLVEQAREASDGLDPHFAARLLDEAGELWRGAPLTHLADGPYRSAQLARLDAIADLATAQRIDAHLALGHHELMIPELQRLVREHPYRERQWCQLMLAQYRAGRRTEALQSYERARTTLREDMGLSPSAALRDLAARIVREDPGLDPEDPPPVSTLPTPLSSFVGRGQPRTELSELLQHRRLVTVTGTGGVGKTRLAIAAANDRRDRWPDGSFFVEMTHADSIDDVVGDLAEAISSTGEGATDSPRDRVERSLAGRSVLLVFDGAEQLADPLGDFVEHLLETAPQVTALVTSRTPLHVPGEHVLELGPMELPPGDGTDATTRDTDAPVEAVELFLERLDAPIPRDDMAAVERLCRLVDGLPLGIELMAAQATQIPVTAVLEQLSNDSQELLAVERAESRDSDPSLELVLQRTMHLLTPSQRTLLGRLSVFREGFDLLGVRAIGDDDAVDNFARLREVALVLPDPRAGATRRFRMLDTTRAFAARLLTPEGAAQAARGHADYYRAVARQIGERPDDPTAIRRLRREGANIRAALRWFLANEPSGAIEFARPLADAADSWLDKVAALALYEQLLDAAEHEPNVSERDRAWIETGIGWPLFLTGHPDRAIELTEDAAARFARIGDRIGAGQAFANRAHMALLATGDQEVAAVWYRRALDELGDSSGSLVRGMVLVEAAQALILADRYDQDVEQMLDEAEGILQPLHAHHRLAHLEMDRSLAAYADDDMDAVGTHALANLHESRLGNSRMFAQIGEIALGVQQLHASDLDRAFDHLRAAVRMAHDDGNVLQTAIALHAVAVHRALSGRVDEASSIWATAHTGAPLWPLFARRYRELMGPELSDRLDSGRADLVGRGDVVPIDRIVADVLA